MAINFKQLHQALTTDNWLCKDQKVTARVNDTLKQVIKDDAYFEVKEELLKLCSSPANTLSKGYQLSTLAEDVLRPLLTSYNQAEKNPVKIVPISRALMNEGNTDGKVQLGQPGRYRVTLTKEDPRISPADKITDYRTRFAVQILATEQTEVVAPVQGKLKLEKMIQSPFSSVQINWESEVNDDEHQMNLEVITTKADTILWFNPKARLNR